MFGFWSPALGHHTFGILFMQGRLLSVMKGKIDEVCCVSKFCMHYHLNFYLKLGVHEFLLFIHRETCVCVVSRIEKLFILAKQVLVLNLFFFSGCNPLYVLYLRWAAETRRGDLAEKLFVLRNEKFSLDFSFIR